MQSAKKNLSMARSRLLCLRLFILLLHQPIRFGLKNMYIESVEDNSSAYDQNENIVLFNPGFKQ